MFTLLGNLVSRYWLPVILLWIAMVTLVRWAAPNWDDVTHDGDFAYLPSRMPSVAGERLMAEAFPQYQTKSQLVVVVAREDGNEKKIDRFVAYDLARRFHNIHGAASIARAKRLADEATELRKLGKSAAAQQAAEQSSAEFDTARAALNEAVALEEQLGAYRAALAKEAATESSSNPLDQSESANAGAQPGPLAAIFHNRWLLNSYAGKEEEANADRKRALEVDPSIQSHGDKPSPEWAADMPVIDVWTWRKELFGDKMLDQRRVNGRDEVHARLVIVHLSTEFTAVENISVNGQPGIVGRAEAELDEVRKWIDARRAGDLELGISGSAAVGSDLLRASAESVQNTEMIAILLVTVILIVVYRSPLLVGVPLVTISLSYLVAVSTVAVLTQVGQLPGFGWWDFMVFKTTKIFIVVILCGTGTDFCLFLIARYREELAGGLPPREAVAKALAQVGDALAASALTTILGLAMMFFAEFGKFRYSGPAIGICLVVTLVACVTLAPALLRAFGKILFWPWGVGLPEEPGDDGPRSRTGSAIRRAQVTRFGTLWDWLARKIVARPGLILVVSVALLMPWAWFGVFASDNVTYDILNGLDPQRPSRQATELLRRHFDVGESGPVIILAQKKDASFLDAEGKVAYEPRDAIWQLTRKLYSLPRLLFSFSPRHQHDLNQLTVTDSLRREFARREVTLTEQAVVTAHGQQPKWLIADPTGGPSGNGQSFLLQVESGRLNVYAPRGVVKSVRSFAVPDGDDPGSTPYSASRTIQQNYPFTKEHFITQVPELNHNVTRIEVVLEHDAFSREATQTLTRIDEILQRESEDPNSFWHGSTFAYAGTTAAMRDLRDVTRTDSTRIEILVVFAVFVVLLIILRRPLVCLYMILSVLFSYYVTLGMTELFFQWAYADDFHGLDWKVPIFLFVILVAIGEDYNVYLATRVFEEQKRLGQFAGLRRAIVRTGGIITSCGVIMAGTFISMTSGTWGQLLGNWVQLPQWLLATSAGPLRSMVELGFALALGVLLDTFVVRPVLLPAFLALLSRWRASTVQKRQVGALSTTSNSS